MSHSSGTTHHSNPSDSTGHPHKITIQNFTDAVNGNHLNNLDKYLDENVEKTLDSQVVYKNLKEAHDYYTTEHTNNKTSHWKIVHFHDNDQKGNTIQAKVTYNNKTFNTKYTFSSAGKIQHIDATLDNNQNPTPTTTHQ